MDTHTVTWAAAMALGLPAALSAKETCTCVIKPAKTVGNWALCCPKQNKCRLVLRSNTKHSHALPCPCKICSHACVRHKTVPRCAVLRQTQVAACPGPRAYACLPKA